MSDSTNTDNLEHFDLAIAQSVKDQERIDKAISIAIEYGGIDGDHHKAWVIDQMVRALAGDRYEAIVAEACDGEDGPKTYSWDV